MNAKIWAPLAAAIVLGLIAAVVARHVLLKTHAAVAAAAKTTTITVAAAPIQPGQEISGESLKTAPIVAPAPPPGTFTSPQQIVGRISVAPIVPGQPILNQFLAPKGAGVGLQALVPPGMRAITIDTNESTGLAGMLIPGCHVDVVATSLAVDNPDRSMSRTIVQDLRVVAVGQRLSGPKADGEKENALSRTVTLLATPHDAQAIDLAMATTRIRLMLRGSGDDSDEDDDGVVMAELRGGAAPAIVPTVLPQDTRPTPTPPPQTQPANPAPAQDEPHRRVVRVIEGSQEHQVIFKEPNPEHGRDGVLTDTKALEQNAVPQPDPFGQ